MTSPPVAPGRTTLAAVPHPGDLSAAVTVVVRVPVANDAMAQAGAPVEDGRSVMTGLLPLGVPVAVIAARIVERAAAQIARASGVGRC
jgi:hypothetical protein